MDIADPQVAPRRSPRGTDITVIAPTRLEYLAVRAARPRCPVVHAGMGLTRGGVPAGRAVIVCGLAGGLTPDLKPGTVVVPDGVATGDGPLRACDPRLARALRDAARALGLPVVTGPLLTVPTMVTGDDRAVWAARGFVAADMETALLPPAMPVATVRVVLDAVSRPISDRWAAPTPAALRPVLLGELVWLGWTAPRYALRAARVTAAALGLLV